MFCLENIIKCNYKKKPQNPQKEPPIHCALRLFEFKIGIGHRREVYTLTLEQTSAVKFCFSTIIAETDGQDRKSTRLNSSHVRISYAVFCLKKKNEATKTH